MLGQLVDGIDFYATAAADFGAPLVDERRSKA